MPLPPLRWSGAVPILLAAAWVRTNAAAALADIAPRELAWVAALDWPLFTVRYGMALLSVLAAAGLYRAARHWTGLISAQFSLLTFAALPWMRFHSIHVAWVGALFTMVGLLLALAIGVILARLPRYTQVGGAAVLLILMIVPINPHARADFGENVGGLVQWLAASYRPGDAVLLAPSVTADAAVLAEWNYFTRQHLPGQLATDPANARRVWYIQGLTKDYAQLDDLRSEYTVRGYHGQPTLLAELYERPPQPVLLQYDNRMQFNGADVEQHGTLMTGALIPGEPATVRLWWSVQAPPQINYSVGIYVLSASGELLTSSDSRPQPAAVIPQLAPPEQTSRWTPGTDYVDERRLQIPADGAVLVMAVYDSATGQRAFANSVRDDGLYTLRIIGEEATD